MLYSSQLHLPGPRETVQTPSRVALCSNIFLGSQQILMHEKKMPVRYAVKLKINETDPLTNALVYKNKSAANALDLSPVFLALKAILFTRQPFEQF